MEEGFHSPSELAHMTAPMPNMLTNSVSLGDLDRLQGLITLQGLDVSDLPFGQLLICKVYLGDEVVDPSDPNFSLQNSLSEIWSQSPTSFTELSPMYRSSTVDSKQKIWFINDH
jgi:hypothetical protein